MFVKCHKILPARYINLILDINGYTEILKLSTSLVFPAINPTIFFHMHVGKKSHSIEDSNEHIIKQLSILDQKLASKVGY